MGKREELHHVRMPTTPKGSLLSTKVTIMHHVIKALATLFLPALSGTFCSLLERGREKKEEKKRTHFPCT